MVEVDFIGEGEICKSTIYIGCRVVPLSVETLNWLSSTLSGKVLRYSTKCPHKQLFMFSGRTIGDDAGGDIH